MQTFTNYEDRVSDQVRSHTASLMQDWIDDGRPDDRIDNLVKSLVLNAYVSGRENGLEFAENVLREARTARDGVVAAGGLVCEPNADRSRVSEGSLMEGRIQPRRGSGTEASQR